MNLGSSSNFKMELFRARRVASAPALLLVGVALLIPSGCRNSGETKNAERKPMTNTSGTTFAANDPLAIHRRAIVIDMHADTTQRLVDEKVDLAQRLSDGHLDSVSASWAGSSGDEAGKTRGLNDFGKQVIREMNRLGMMVDVSHLSDKAFWDIVNTSTRPVIATHSGCRAITNMPRNLSDDMIIALAKTGGVVNVIFYPEHIEPGYAEKKKKVDGEIALRVQEASTSETGDVAHKKLARDRVRQEEYLKRLPPVSVTRIVDHIDHIVKLVGIDHVGIGSDFDGVQVVPADLKSVADLPNLTTELLKRGYSEADIDKILGGNMLRVMEQVERK